MSNQNEAGAALSPTAKEALERLQKEGYEVGTDPSPADPEDGEIKDPAPKKEEAPKEEKPVEKKEETPNEPKKPDDKGEEPKKPEREISYVPAWKLKVAESQKEALEKEIAELRTKREDMVDKNKSGELSKENKEELSDDIKSIAEKYGYDENFIKDIETVITKKTAVPKELI